MKTKILFILAVVLGMLSCAKDELPSNPIRQYPVKTLIVTVGSADYLAVPKMNADKSFNDTLALKVTEGLPTATVKKIVLSGKTDAVNIAEGQEITFVDDKFTIIVNEGQSNEHKYCIDMIYDKPEPEPEVPLFLYVTHSAILDMEGGKFWLDPANLESYTALKPLVEGDKKFEGHIYLGNTDWVNLSFVQSDFKKSYTNANDGFPGTSGVLALTENEHSGADHNFPGSGIWADWTKGSGVWMFRVDTESPELTGLCTQWTVAGTAAGATALPMTYGVESGKWTTTISLSEGALKFTTTPVAEGDRILTYGASGAGRGLKEDGAEIMVAEAGEYVVTLDLSTAPEYVYSLVKKGEDPKPDLQYMYLTNTNITGPTGGKCYVDPATKDDRSKYSVLASADKGVTFEGYAHYTEGWQNISFVHADLKKYYDSAAGLNGSETSKTMDVVEKTGEANYFPAGGPWGDWTLGSGVWMFSLNTSTKKLTALCTVWAITGSTVSDTPAAMTYDKASRKWTLTAMLAAGAFKFTTIPVSEGDPTMTYGQKSGKKLAADGGDIAVAEAGNYVITLNLSEPMDYSYSIVKQ